jgi:hypothetical protein
MFSHIFVTPRNNKGKERLAWAPLIYGVACVRSVRIAFECDTEKISTEIALATIEP